MWEHKIQLKKISPFGFGSSGGRLRYYRICSRATTLKFFVERCGSLGESILLVEYIILQSIKLTLLASFGIPDILFGFFKIFAKKWEKQLTPSKRSTMFISSKLGMRLPSLSQVTSGFRFLRNKQWMTRGSILEEISNKNFLLEGSFRRSFLFFFFFFFYVHIILWQSVSLCSII